MRADGGLALTGGSGKKGSEFEHILKEPLTGFPDGLDVGHESKKQSTLPLSFFPRAIGTTEEAPFRERGREETGAGFTSKPEMPISLPMSSKPLYLQFWSSGEKSGNMPWGVTPIKT